MAQPATSDGNATAIRLAVIGDVHGKWDPLEDAEALRAINCDAAVFVGDFNEEDIPLIQEIASLDHPKAVILGNHDAWTCLTNWSVRINKDRLRAGYDSLYSGVEMQLDILGSFHVGYDQNSFTAAGGVPFAIVGGRPFSKGGHRWSDCKDFYMQIYQVPDVEASAKRIADTVLSLPEDTVPVLAAHNGPTNLGSQAWSISGVDFKPGAGDHGDRDLELALQQIHAKGRKVPLVVFGHMHESLQGTRSLRNMVEVDAKTGTVYLNTAVVPRVRNMVVGDKEAVAHHFCIAELQHGVVQRISNAWVSRGEDGKLSVHEHCLLERGFSSEGDKELSWCRVWRGYTKTHELVDLQ